MVRYNIEISEKRIDVYGYDQYFNDEEKKDLWEKYNILYVGDILAVWVEKRKGRKGLNPLIHFIEEDDGHLFWRKEKDVCFDSYWLDNYIYTLSELKNRLKV